MISDLSVLYDNQMSAVVIDILKKYENSEDHKVQIDKLSRGRFIALFREKIIREQYKT